MLRVLIFVRMGLSRTWSFFLTQHQFGGFLKWGCPTNGCVVFMFFWWKILRKVWMNRGTTSISIPFLHLPEIGLNSLRCLPFLIHQLWQWPAWVTWVSPILRQTQAVDVGRCWLRQPHCPMISKSYSTRNPNYTPWIYTKFGSSWISPYIDHWNTRKCT